MAVEEEASSEAFQNSNSELILAEYPAMKSEMEAADCKSGWLRIPLMEKGHEEEKRIFRPPRLDRAPEKRHFEHVLAEAQEPIVVDLSQFAAFGHSHPRIDSTHILYLVSGAVPSVSVEREVVIVHGLPSRVEHRLTLDEIARG
nr:hypothetical protein LR48_Vigan01g075600 [Ipomoea batatas]